MKANEMRLQSNKEIDTVNSTFSNNEKWGLTKYDRDCRITPFSTSRDENVGSPRVILQSLSFI